MKIHEYQARQILSDAGIPVPPAEVVRSADEAATAFKKFGGQMCVVKAQVYAGGRGKAGFVKLCNTEAEVRARLAQSRTDAGANRSIRPGAGFIDAMRNDPTTSDLPLDRQTAVAIEAMQATRANARAAQPTRPTVTRHPVANSSVIAEMGYDDATGRVEVVMHSPPIASC